MNIIKNNPYRIIGVLSDASAREKDKQMKQLFRLLESEQNLQDKYSFPVLGKIERTKDTVLEASSKLNLDKDKLYFALFWFYNGNPITDEPAFQALQDSDTNRAINIWRKLIRTGEVTSRNSSAFHNLSTLLLCNCTDGISINKELLEEGLILKLKFLDSDFINDFVSKVTDITFKTSKKEIQIIFLNALHDEIKVYNKTFLNNILEIILKLSFSAREDFLKSFIQKIIEEIEKKINITKAIRKANKANAAKAAEDFYSVVISDLTELEGIIGENNFRYTSICDKVAEEILQCGIEYFLHYKDTDMDPGEETMELFKKAESFAKGNLVKQRCKENLDNILEWINNKSIREKEKQIKEELEFIKEKIEEFKYKSNSISDAINFTKSCDLYLQSIKNKLGPNDELYISLSSIIVYNAMALIVSVVNEAIEKRYSYVSTINNLENTYPYIPNTYPYIPYISEYSLETLKSIISEAWSAILFLDNFDMDIKLRIDFNENKKRLKEFYEKLNPNSTFIKNRPINKWLLYVPGAIIFLLIINAIFGKKGINLVCGIVFILVILLSFLAIIYDFFRKLNARINKNR